jgi:hypothetical protein
VISTGGGLRQRASGSLGRLWKPNDVPTLIKHSQGPLSLLYR